MRLYAHQQEALRRTEGMRRVAYYLDMGLGKTYVGSEKMRVIGSPRNLIVCQKSKIEDWKAHLEENYPEAMVYDLTRQNAIEDFMACPRSTGIINYELAWRRERLLGLRGFTLMLDESSLIQNSRAKQTKFMLKLRPDAVILLSGTPTSGKYENLWSQARLLGWGIAERTFQSHYVNYTTLWLGGTPVRTIDRTNPYKNVERLKGHLREHGAVFMTTEDVMDMPEQTFTTVRVARPKEYARFMRDGIVEAGGDLLVGDTPLTKRIRARQLCGSYAKGKLKAFSELLESTNDRLVVFYCFERELEELRRAAKDRPCSTVNGHGRDLTAYEREPDSVTFCQYQAGAMGLNLQKANKMVYFTLPERSELFEQSKKRIHRIGQERPCFYYVLQCGGTIEEDILAALKRRQDYTQALFEEGC